jgi:hypothetical protein
VYNVRLFGIIAMNAPPCPAQQTYPIKIILER